MDPDSHKGINSTATLFPTPQAHPQLALCAVPERRLSQATFLKPTICDLKNNLRVQF